MGFRNPTMDKLGTLIRTLLKSDNYVAGTSGWRVTRDGAAEFNGGVFRGSIQIGNPATGEIIIDNTLTGALQAAYNPMGTISSATIRLIPSDGSYFYILAGFNPVSGNDFAAMGNAKPGAAVAADIAQQWFSIFNSGTNISQINLGDPDHDQRVLVNSNFTQFGGGGLNGNIDMYGILQLLGGQDIRVFSAGPSAQPTVIIAHDGEIFFGGGTNPVDTLFGRVGAASLASDPIAALNGARTGAEVWNALTLNTPWTNRGAGFPVTSYRNVAAPYKSVQLVGQLTVGGAASGSVIGTLPVGYRPTTAVGFPAANDGAAAGVLIEVETNGDIKAFGGFSTHIQICHTFPKDL